MIRASIVAVATLLVAAAGVAEAQTPDRARVRAGEHSGYSRIAIDVSRLGEWAVRRSGRRLVVSFPGRSLDFDTRQIFPMRRVTRVSNARGAVSQDGSTLTLSMTCACESRAYVFDDDMLVIDIRSDDAADRSPFPRSAAGRADADRGAIAARRDVVAPPDEAPIVEPSPPTAAAAEPNAAFAAPAAQEPDPVVESTPDSGPHTPPDLPDDVRAAQRILREQLTRAADQGLVRFREGAESPPVEAPVSQAVDTPAAVDDRLQDLEATVSGERDGEAASEPLARATRAPDFTERAFGPQLAARTAFDAARQEAFAPAPERDACRAAIWLDVSNWADDADFYKQLSERRARLVEEFDRPSRDASLDLARLYLRFGFGFEARQRLEILEDEDDAARLIRDAAYVIEGDRLTQQGALAEMAGCPGAAAVWRTAGGLNAATGERDTPDARQAFLGAFETLPVDMRRLLGPAVLDRLVFEDELDLAEAVRLLLDRAAGDHGSSWRLASGRLAAARGETARADVLFARVAQGRDDTAAEALVHLAELRGGGGKALGEGLVESLGVAATARAGTSLGLRLLVAEVRGRAGRNELGVALDIIEAEQRSGGRRSEDLDAAMRRILSDADAGDMAASDYASAIMKHLDRFGGDAEWDEARVAVSRQLAGLGLGNAAEDVLGPALARGTPEARIAAAEARVAVGDAAGALAMVEGLDQAAAHLARSAAMDVDGRYQDALGALDQAGIDPEERPELSWRAGEWSSARALSEPARSGLAAWLASGGGSTFAGELDAIGRLPNEPSLEAVRELLEASQNARAVIEGSLDDG